MEYSLALVNEIEVITRGLTKRGQRDISVPVNERSLTPEVQALLHFVVRYVERSNRVILPNETLAYGYWLLKFVEKENKCLEIWEYDSSCTEFVPGAALAVAYWRDQHQICNQFAADFTTSTADKLALIDEGVIRGCRIDAVRYPSPEHMSGWWITSDQYTGPSDLRTVHLYHVTSARPDIAPYLALPYGFRFNFWGSEPKVHFDEAVAKEARE